MTAYHDRLQAGYYRAGKTKDKPKAADEKQAAAHDADSAEKVQAADAPK